MTNLFEKTINNTILLKRELGIIALAIAIFSTLSFLSTYSFLFGYYFGGDSKDSFSNFELFRRFIPFHINTLTYTYLMVSLSVTLIIYSLNLFKENNFTLKMFSLFCFFIFHLLMTLFFSNEFSISNILYFSLIWILPIFIGVMFMFILQGTKAPFRTFSGAFFGFSIMILIIVLFQFDTSNDWVLILLNLILFLFGILFSFISFRKYWNFIFIYPYAFLSTLFIIWITNIEYYFELSAVTKLITFLLIPLLVSILLSKLLTKKINEHSETKENQNTESVNSTISDFLLIFINPRTHKRAIVFLIITLLSAYVMTPRVSTATAKIIRSFTPGSESQFDLITYKNIDGKPITIKGIIVAEQDGVIFISNNSWKLEQVKTSSYVVKKPNE